MNNPVKRKVLRLKSGRQIYLEEIAQWRTYGCLLEGIPRKQLNDEIIANSIPIARNKISYSGPIHLVQPRIKAIKLTRDKSQTSRLGSKYEQIPSITCAAIFDSPQPARDKACFSSSLIILWFQDNWAMPIDSHILIKIRNVDWDKLAEDCMP